MTQRCDGDSDRTCSSYWYLGCVFVCGVCVCLQNDCAVNSLAFVASNGVYVGILLGSECIAKRQFTLFARCRVHVQSLYLYH